MSQRDEMEAAVEAVLFVSSEPIARARLLELFDEADRELAGEAVDAVLARYAPGDGRGVEIEEVAGGVRLVTRPEMNDWLRRFFEVSGSTKLSMAALETLAIVAYRQPVTGPEIQELRSVNSSGVLKTLLDRHLVRIAGRKEVVGRPFLYCTTREFLVHFGLKSLKDLPPLEEFEEIFDEEGDTSMLGGAVESGEVEDREAPEPEPAEERRDREAEVAAQIEAIDEAIEAAAEQAAVDADSLAVLEPMEPVR